MLMLNTLRKCCFFAAIMIGAIGALSESPEQWNSQEDRILAILKENGIGPENCYLQGEYITGNDISHKTIPYDKKFSYDWNFKNGTLCGISEHSSGIKNLENRNGALSFDVTKKNSYFGWGNVDLLNNEIKLASDYLNSGLGLRGQRLYGFIIRIKQTLPESTWTIGTRARLLGWPSELYYSKPVKIKGTNWQTVFIKSPQMGLLYKKQFVAFSGVRLQTSTPGNKVEIQSVVPCIRELHPFFRKDFALAGKVRRAKVSITGDTFFKIYVNGKLAVESPPMRLRFEPTFDYTLSPELFKKGKNTIVMETYSNSLLFDGAILCDNGDYLRIDSDESWKVKNGEITSNDLQPSADTKDWESTFYRYKHSFFKYQRKAKEYWTIAGKNPSWKGMLSVNPVNRKQPVYGKDENIDLRILAPIRKDKKQKISYVLYDEMGNNYRAYDTEVKRGALSLRQSGLDNVAFFKAKAGTLEYNKAYALVLKLFENGKEVEKYRYEFAICGPIKQPVITGQKDYTSGLKLKLVYEIDAAAPTEKGEFVSCTGDKSKKHGVIEVPSTVIKTPLGKFRQTYAKGNNGGDTGLGNSYISWKYHLKNPERPHIITAEYPDDTVRCQSMLVTDGPPEFEKLNWRHHMFNSQIGNDTVILGVENPLTNKVKNHHVLIFPKTKLGAITFFSIGFKQGNWSSERPARIGKIKIYEVLGDIPQLKINDAPGTPRWIGQRLEPGPRVVWQSCFPGRAGSIIRNYFILKNTANFYRNWMLTYTNLIKRMRFAGENCIGYGVYMYNSVFYPGKFSHKTNFAHNICSGSLRDSMGLMAKMFEENDLGIFASLEVVGFADMKIEKSNDEVAKGAESILQIDKYGKQLGSRLGCVPNWTHQGAKKYLNTVVEELKELYGNYRAFKGLIFYAVPDDNPWGPSWATSEKEPYMAGYGDHSIAVFEKDTGIKVPVSMSAPDRFMKRYEWIKKNALPQWSQWRQDKITEIYREIAKSLKSSRKDLKVVCLVLSRGYLEAPLEDDTNQKHPFEYLAPMGIDAKTLKKTDDVIFAKYIKANETLRAYLKGSSDRSWRAKAHNPKHTSVFANDGKSAVAVGYSWAEAQQFSPKGWPMMYSGVEAWPFPAGEFAMDYYTNIFIRTNPSMMLFGIVDQAMWNGREPELAKFAQAFRSVPNGIYKRLSENGRDKNLWIEICRYGKDVYGYVANPQCWDIHANIIFDTGLSKFDLIENRNIDGNKWSFKLAPYQIKTFKIIDCQNIESVKSAQTIVSNNGQIYVTGELDKFKNKVNQNRSALKESGKLDKADKLIKYCENMIADDNFDAAAEALSTSTLWDTLFNLSWTPKVKPKKILINKIKEKPDLNDHPSSWGGKPVFKLDKSSDIRISIKPWTGPRDYSLLAYARWDKKFLYLGFRGYDDDYMPKLNASDCVEVYIDAELFKDYGHSSYNEDDFNLKLVPPLTNSNKPEFVFCRGTKNGTKLPDKPDGIIYTGKKLQDGFQIAVAIPWTRLCISPEKGMEIGFDTVSYDADKGELKNYMFWSAPGKSLFSFPRVMGRAVLQ